MEVKIERRSSYSKGLEVRAADGAKLPTITGYAAVFNVLSEDLGGWRELILPGAFDGVLQQDVRALWQHGVEAVLGRAAAKTLRLSVDEVGLAVEIDPPDTEQGRAAVELVRRGDVTQMSFGFSVDYLFKGGVQWVDDERGAVRLVGRLARLYEVSLVTFPAYPDTSAAVRSLAEARAADGWREAEQRFPVEGRARKLRQLLARRCAAV